MLTHTHTHTHTLTHFQWYACNVASNLNFQKEKKLLDHVIVQASHYSSTPVHVRVGSPIKRCSYVRITWDGAPPCIDRRIINNMLIKNIKTLKTCYHVTSQRVEGIPDIMNNDSHCVVNCLYCIIGP